MRIYFDLFLRETARQRDVLVDKYSLRRLKLAAAVNF